MCSAGVQARACCPQILLALTLKVLSCCTLIISLISVCQRHAELLLCNGQLANTL